MITQTTTGTGWVRGPGRLGALALATYFIYLPGVSGTFLLDDFSTLRDLRQVGDLAPEP